MGITAEENDLEAVYSTGAKYLISRRRVAIPRHDIVVSCHDTMVSSCVTFTRAGCEDS